MRPSLTERGARSAGRPAANGSRGHQPPGRPGQTGIIGGTGIRGEHGIAHPENRRAPAHRLGRRERVSDMVRAVAGLLSHQQTADLSPARQM
ncbi:hypothetical protein ACIGW4_26340 [Streptomyces sp. NPDC053513]|uniref:hypothetical protein n=1 Tax=unclassified Streptomyces TaxID=2593676 RepID=UPI0037D4F6B9